IGPRAEACRLVGEEGVAAVDGDAGSVGKAQPVHIVERVQIAAGVGAVNAVVIVGGGAAGEFVILGAWEDVLEERNRWDQVRVGLNLRGSDAAIVDALQERPGLRRGLSTLPLLRQ